MKRCWLITVTALAFISLCLPFPAVAQEDYDIIQLTDDDYWVYDPQIDNGQVVWSGYDGEDTEIYLWTDGSVTQLTDNDVNDYFPQIDAGQVVWIGHDGNDTEIYLWDGSSVKQLTDNYWDDWGYPQIDEGQVVWSGRGNSGWDLEIFHWQNDITTQITDNNFPDIEPKIDNGQVVWSGYDSKGVVNVFFWDGNSTEKINSKYSQIEGPQIHDGKVVWADYDDNDREIFFWDGYSLTQVTDNEGHDFYPQIEAGRVVWHGEENYHSGYEIFLWENDEIEKLTDTGYNRQLNPRIDNGQIAWYGHHDAQGYEVFLWSEGHIQKITDNDKSDVAVQIDDGHLVWRGWDGNDYEIFLAIPSRNQPPLANAGPSQTIILGELVILDGTASSDPDGYIVSYEWDFGDGYTGSGDLAEHLYDSDGLYQVTLTVTDDYGDTNSATTSVSVLTHSEATQAIVDIVENIGLPGGTENSLISKLDSAINSIENYQDKAAKNKLNAFLNSVEAQRGKKITNDIADELTTEVKRILSVLFTD